MIRSQIALMERNGASADADLVLDAQAALLQAVSPEELARRHRDPAALAGRIRETLLGAMREDIQCLKSQIDTVDAQLEALRSELVLGGEVGMSGAGVATAFHVDPYEKRRAAVYRTASVAMFCLTVLLFAFATMETLTLFGIRLFGFAGGAAMGILLSIIADATLGRLLPKSKASRGRAIRALAATGLVCFVISGGVFLALRSGLESGEPWLLPAALTCFEATLLFVAAVLGNAHRLYTYAERLARNFAELQRYRFELRANLREALHESKNAIPSSATRGEYSLAVSSGVFAPWFGHARLVLSAAAVTIFVAAIVLGHAGFRSQPSPSSGDSRTSARAPVRFVVVLDVSRSFSQQQDFRVMANRLASVLRASAPFIGGVGVRGSGLTDVPAEFFWGPPPSPPSPPSVSERLLLFSANQAALQAAIRGEQQKRTEEYNRRIEMRGTFSDGLRRF
ncbi:MAG: hypothetical protein HY296_08355 [Thaumarchaeota archaeon]|nr:hypothetical protein [Nitrososphaerota archaeon]